MARAALLGVLIGGLAASVRAFAPSLSRRSVSRLTLRTATVTSTAASDDKEAEILALLTDAEGRGKDMTPSQLAQLHELATELERSRSNDDDDTNASELLPGRWRVLYQVRVVCRAVAAAPRRHTRS